MRTRRALGRPDAHPSVPKGGFQRALGSARSMASVEPKQKPILVLATATLPSARSRR
jgi:hypothetical protein